jgi:hypothetical protein
MWLVPGTTNEIELSTDSAGQDIVGLMPSTTEGATHLLYVGNTSNYLQFDSVTGVNGTNNQITIDTTAATGGAGVQLTSAASLNGVQVTYERLVAYNANTPVTLSTAQLTAYTNYYESEAQYRAVTGVSGGDLQFGSDPGFTAGDEVTFTSGGSNIAGLTDGYNYYVVADGSSGVSLSSSPTGSAISLTLANGATTLTGAPGLQLTANSASLTAYVQSAVTAIEQQDTQEYHTLNAVWGAVGNINSSPEVNGVLTQYSPDIYDPNFSYSASTTQIQQVALEVNTSPITVGTTTYAAGQAVYVGTNVFTTGQAVVFNADTSVTGGGIAGLTSGSTYTVTEISGNAGWIALSNSMGVITLGALTGTDNYFVSSTVNDPRLHQSATQVNGNEIYIGTNAFTNGQAVVYNAASNGGISGLTNGSTYYVIEIPNSVTDNTNSGWISLASTSGGAPITLGAQGALTGNNWFSDGDVFSQNAAWSAAQLQNSINVNILAPKDVSSTQAYIQNPVITANNIAVIAKNGNIGSNDGYLYFNLPLENLTTADEIAIAAAQRQDITFYSGPLVNGLPTGNVISLDYYTVSGVSGGNLQFGSNPGFTAGQEVVFTSGGSNITGLTDGGTYYVVADTSSGVSLSKTQGGAAITLANVATLTGTPNLQPTGYQSVAIEQNWNVEFKTTAKGTVYFSARRSTSAPNRRSTSTRCSPTARSQLTAMTGSRTPATAQPPTSSIHPETSLSKPDRAGSDQPPIRF